MGSVKESSKKSTRIPKGEYYLIAAFCLSCCEIFFLYRNFRIPTGYAESVVIPMFGSFIAVISALAFYAVLLVIYLGFKKKVDGAKQLVAGCAAAAIAPLIQLIAGHFFDQSWIILPCIIVSAAGFTCFLPELVRRLAQVGVSCSIRCNIIGCVALLIFAPTSISMPVELFIGLMCLNPIAILLCLRASTQTKVAVATVEVQENQKVPKILLLTVVAASVMEGVVAAADYLNMSIESKLTIFSSAYVVSAILMFTVLLRSRGSYNNAIFRVCFPIMALGLSMFVFGGDVALNLGSLVFLVGRQLFAAIILALVVYLVRYRGSDYYLLSVSVVMGAMLGSSVGLALYGYFGQASATSILPPAFIVYVLLGVLLVAVYLTNASNLKTCWGMVAIDDSEDKVGMTFEQSCLILAEKWGLTRRESEIVALMAKGRDKQAIAERLFISEGTVKVHSRNIYQKMGIHSKQELIDLVENTEESIKE